MRESLLVRGVSKPDELAEIYRLRFESLTESDADPGPGPVVTDEWDDSPHCPVFGLYNGGDRIVGSIRPCTYSSNYQWRTIPALDLYAEEILNLGDRQTIVQSTHFVISPAHRGLSINTKLPLYGIVLRTARANSADFVVTIIRNTDSQLAFYARMGFKPIGPGKIHPVSQREGVLVAVALDDLIRTVESSKIFRPMLEY